MGLPWEIITATSAISTLTLAWAHDDWSKSQLLGRFPVLWIAGFAVWVVWAVWIYPLLVSPLRHLPGPSGNHWLMGQSKKIMAEPSGVPMRQWASEIPNDGLICYRGFFNQERVMVSSPKALAEVLVTNSYAFPKPSHFRWSIGRILGVGVLLAEGEEHKMQRRSLTPAFAFRHIKNLYPVFWRKAREVTRTMMAEFGQQEETQVEISGWASRATLDIIGLAGMGRDFGAIQNPDNTLAQTYSKIFKPSRQAQILAFVGMIIPMEFITKLPFRRNEDIAEAASDIRAICRDLIQEKKAKMANKEQADVDILSVALESGGFTDENLVDQLMTFLAAGHETTASAMTWAIYMLSRHSDIQARLREEIRESLPSVDSDVDITSLDIDRMPYLNAVCSEVLRYYAPVPLTMRDAAYDTTILGQPIRRGTRIVIVPWATHFDHDLWGPDADQFNPDRWLSAGGESKNGADRKAASGGASSNYAFLTFLHGPRSCIGSSFAKAEFACLLAAWIGRFEFSLANPEEMDEKNVEIRGGVTARPAKGMHVKVKVSRDRDLTPRAGDQGDSPHSRSYSRQQPPYQQQQPQSPTQQRQYDPQRQDQFQIYQQSPQQNSYPYQNQYHQQQQPYYSAPSQSMPGYNSPYQQQQNPQRPQTPSSVFSSSSDTSTSLLDISRFKDTKEYGGLLSTFFKAPSERVKQRLHRKKSKKRRVLYFGNSSSSSVNSDLAYGNGYVRQPKSRTLSPRSQSRVSGQGYGSAAGVGPGPSNGRRRSSGGSDRAARLTPKKKKTADEEIMALGQQLSNLARLSKEDEQRQARKASGKGKGKAAALGLAAGAAGAAMASQYGQEKNGRMVNGLKQRVQSSDDEDEWEDASEDEDDDSSSSDGAGSAADSELAYGTVAESIKPALGAAAAAGSAAAAAGMAGPRRQSGYGYDSSPEYRRHGDRGSVVDPRLFGPYNSLRGSINTPCGFRNDDEAVAYRRDSANFGNGTPIHMRDMHSDPNRYDGERFSAPIAQQDPSARPAPVPLQQPVPKTPISSKVYDAVKVDGANRRSHSQRRSEQPEEKDWSGVATGGLAAAAAAAAAAGVAMTTSSKKDSREHRDEQQRDRDDRENQRRIDRDRQRALELEEQKLRELERQKLREQHRAQNPESEADRHERLEKERARNMKWEREYREMEPEAIIPNYNNERKSSRYNDDTPKDRSEKKEKSNVDVVVAPKSDQNEGRPFGIQYGPEFQLEREPTVQAGTSERKATRNGRDLPLATGAGHRAVTESAKSAHQDIDPFQYQVSDDAFTMSQTTTPGRPLTPNVVTIEREPNFDDSPPRDSAADVRLSRRDSFEIQRMVEDYRESQGASQRRDPRNGHEYEEEEHKARSILDEAKHATIPVAAAAVASAVAVENERSQERRKGRYSEDSSQDTSRRRKDVVQEEADRYYRETNIARKIASDEMRSRSASPERSVVDRWQESKNESFSIVTPPVMEDKHPEKNIYEGPDADVKIDNKIHPREEHQYRNPDENPSRRNVSRERPLLNLIYPTPAVSRQHTPAPEARKEPEVTEVVAKPEDFSIGPKGEIISVSEPASAAKSVSWGENETKRFDADSPEKSDNDNYFPSEKAVEKSRPKLNKASRWGILAAALAGSSAEPQNEPDVEVDPKQTEMPGGYSYSDAGSSDVSIRRAEFYVDDMNSFPPVVGTKPASPQQMPGRFADDFEFAATLAAGLKDTGFNPDIVIDDPSYSRRDSPPGVQEANGDSHSGSNGNAWYKRPYAEVAPEPVDAPKLLPERGFVLGEVETPQEKTALPYESERNIRSDAPKPEDVPLPNNQSDSPRPSKQEQRKREKSDVVVVQDDGKIETGRAEPEPSREAGEAVWEDISRKKSNKGRKKDRKGRDFEDEWSPSVSAPAPYESRSDYDRSISQDQGRDHDISVSDVAKVAVPAALALGAIASGSRDASSRDIRTDMSDSPAELRKQPNDDYYYDGDRSRVSAPAEPSHHRHSSRDVASLDIRSDDEHNSSKHLRKHKKDRESRDEGRYRESSTLEPNDRRSSRRESSRDRSRDRSRHRDHRSKDRSRDRTRDRSRDRTRDSSRDRSHRRRSDDEEERPKRSKRHPYEYDSPTQSMAASEISVASSSSKRSKKSKRRNDAGDDYNDSRDSPSHRRHESFDDRDASSVVSESRGHRRTPSRYDDDDAKSVSSVPGSSRREKDYKERRTPEKRPSTSVLSGLFKPRKDKKDSFLGNADTLGAGVGLATAADIYASDAARSNAADAPSDREPSASGDGLRHVRSFELVDPEVIPRVIKPAIDPQYGDLLPLPPSEPSSPTSSVSGELPPLPDSRPDTPPEERGARREPWPQQRRRSIFETPMKSPSRTAVPIALRLGNRSSNPASPVSYRASPASSPIISHSDAVVMSRRQARPTSWDNSREFMPLYLLEQSRHPAPTTGSVLPALPPSEPSETSARNSPESEFLKQNDDYFGEDPEYAGPDLRVDTVLSEQQKDSDAESQQTTPRAEFMPVLPEPTPSVPSNEPTPGLSEPKLPEPTPTAAPDPPTPSLATPMESGSRDVASDERSAPPFDAAAIAVPVGLGASAGLAAAALIQVRDRAEPPAEKPDDLTSADEHFSDAVVGPSEPTSPGENISRSLSFAMDREPTSESIAKSPYEPSSETTTGAFTTPVNELVADGLSDSATEPIIIPVDERATESIAEPSVEEPVVEECAETQESTIEDGTTSAKDLVPEAPENIQEPESTKQIIEPTPIDMAAEEPSRDLTTEPMIEDVTTVAPESSPQPTKELVAEPWADFIPEAVEPADELENEAAGQGAVDLPKSSDEPDTMPQRELVVENVSVTEPRIENTKEETEDLGRETDNTSMALAPDTIEEPQTAPSVDVPTETTAEAVEPAEVKPEQPVAERAVNEITTEEWDNMNAKDRKNMKKKLKKQGLEPIIQDSFDFPAPVDDLSKDDQPSLSNGVNADDKASTSKLVTAEPETRAPFVSELVPEAFAEPSIVAEAEGVQEPAVFQGEEHVSIVPEEVSHPIEDDVLPVNKELAIQPEAESTEKEPEVYFKPAAPIAEHEPAPELSATAPTVTEPLPGATPEEKAAEELPESPSKSKKKKKIRTQQPPQEEPTPVEPTTVLAEDTTIDSAPTPQAEKEAFNAWTDPVVSIETPAATPVDLPVEQSSTAVEDPLQPSTELSQDAPVESSVDADTVDADTFDAWAQPDTVANTDVPDQEQDKHAKTAEQLSELSNAPMQEDAVSSKSKKNKKKKKGTKTDDEPVTEPQDSKSQGKSLEEPEKATYDLTEPSVPAADTKPETIDNAQADEATSSKSAVSTPKHDGGQAAKSVKKSRADKPVLAAPVPNSRELDDLDDVPYSPSSGNQSPSTGDVRKDRQGYFPSSLRTFPGAAGISAFKRMWGFQDQARAQNRMREALPDVARPSSETQPDTVSAEKSKVAEAKPGVPIVEVDSDKAAANKLLTSSDSHISEPLFSQGDALVEESQATTIELEPSQGAEPQNATVHVSDDVPDKGRSTAVEQPVVKTEDEPVRPTEIALEAPREILDGAIEGEDVKSVENPSIEIISNTTPAVEGKSDDTAEDKPMEMTNDDVEKPAEAKPELVTEEEPDKTAEAEDTKTAEEATGDNTEADASGSKKMAKKNKKKKKNQAGQDETTEHENDSAQQDQAIQEPPIEEVIHVSNGVDNQALASESVAEASRDIPEELKALNRSQTDDKPVEGEAKEEDKIDDEPTQIQSKEEPPMSEKPENTPEAQPEENPEDKLQGSDQLPEAEATKQPQNDHKLMEPENQASSETNHSAAQAEDGPTNPEAQLLPQIDDKSQVEAEESQQMDGKPIESHAQETLHTDDKTAENETKESDSDVKLPQAEALKENDKLVQPEVVEQTQTDDKPTQVEVIDDNTVGSEAKYPSSSEKQANEAISEEPPQAARDVIAMPSVDDILPPATLKAGSPKAGSVAMKIKEAESKALRQAEGAAAAKDNAEIEALLEKQSRRGGRLLKKDQKRLATLQENVAQRTEAQAARDPPPQAAQEPTNSTSADVDVQKPSEVSAESAQPTETRDIDIPQDTAPVNEATVTTERQIDISETQPTETSGEAETVGAGLLNEATEILTDVPSEKKPMDDETTTDTAPAAEPQEKTVVDNEVMEPEISKKSEKKQKRKSVSFSENGGSQDPATENTDTRILATEPEQLDQTVVNTEDTPAQAELVPEEAPATQDMPQVLAPEDAPVDVQSSDAEETEAPPLKNPEVPLAENTTAESQAEGPSDVTLDKAESEPASEKKSKKKRKKKKDTSTDEPEKQPEAESSNEATSESTSKVSDDAKDSIGQEASSGTPNPTDPVDDETAEASPLPLGSEAANISSEILPTNNEQAQPADGEKPVEISPCQKPASAIEASEAPGAVVPEQTPTEQPVVPNIEEPESPAKLSKKDKKKKKKKADKKKAALEEESKEPKSEPTTSFEKGEVEVERETAEHTAEDPKVTRDETSEQTDSKETPKGDIILEGEIATPANEAKVPDTGNSGELPSEEPASPEDERGGFSLSQSQTDQKNKAKDSDFEIVQDIKTNHPTQPETVRQDAAAAVVDEAQSQGSSEGTQRQEDKTVAVHLDPPVEPETKLESGLGLGKEKEKLDDDEEFAGLSKKQIKKLKKARALATPESSVEAEMPKESGTSLEEAATPATEAGTESEPTPQTCAESAAETTTGAEQELGYETMNDPLPDIEETVPIIEPDFEAELESKTENQSLDNTDIQPATERADDEPDVDADLQTRQPKSDGQTTSEQDIIVPVPEVDSGDNLTDVPDKSSSTNLPAEHQVVKKPDSSRVEDATEPPQMLGEPAENIQDSRSIIEVETGPIIPDKLEQTDVTTEDIPSSSPDMAEKTTEAQIPMEAELPKPVEINQPLEEVLTDAPAESMDENAPEKAMQSPHEPILQSLGDPTQSSNHETVELEAISEPAAPVETTPACDTQPSSTDATKLAEQTPLDLLPSSDLFSSTPVLPADPSSPQQRVSEPTEPESTERDLSITIDETGPSSVAPDIVTSEDTVIPDTQTVPVSEESDKSVESNVEKQLEETSQPHEPNSVLQPVVTGSLMAPVDSPLNEKPIEDTSPSSYPTTDVASVPEPEQAPEEETEANQDISNEAAIDKAREESVQLTKEKPAVPVVERQQQPVSHDHPLDSSTSQSDRQVTDDRYNEKAQFFKEDAEREVFEESGPSETNDIVPDTAALPDFSANPSSELVDTPGINEPEKSERGENEFTTEEWQSLAGKEKKNIKKKLKRKGLDLIIQDSFQPTTSGSEALPETDTEPELVLTQPEDLTARVTEAEAQTEKSQEASVNKTSDKEQAEPTSQTTAGQKNIPTESPPSQETTLVTEVKSDKQEIAEGHVVSPSEGKDKETAELEGKDEAEVPVTVKTPDEFEMPPFFEEPQHRSGSQQDLPVPSTAKNETSQEAETDVTPVELISETKAEPPTSHEPGYRVTT
ncbi:hypothetical protein EDB82DRAFT_442080, partial [Fusarium venenatum]|uniref:uncharacterized protein n=1 Tax=Fusarium venenatum TaxID=56646 RepID=UPI001D24B847